MIQVQLLSEEVKSAGGAGQGGGGEREEVEALKKAVEEERVRVTVLENQLQDARLQFASEGWNKKIQEKDREKERELSVLSEKFAVGDLFSFL